MDGDRKNKPRKIIHADCDCFFAAVEMRDNPALRDKPIAVGGSADKRGVIATCNYAARAFGVHSAMPTAQALKLCPKLVLCSGRMDEYKATAARIRAIFYQLTDRVEVVSIDEAYLDVSNVSDFQGSATRMAQWLKAEVQQQVGVTISIGIASNKFLAKVASDWQKPDGLFVIHPDYVADFIPSLAVGRIHGVGKVTEEKLKKRGILTCADLQTLPMTELSDVFGKFGITLYQRARGDDYREVVTERIRKSVSVERTFSQNISDSHQLQLALDKLLPILTQRYQGYESRQVRSVFAKVRFADFTATTVESTLNTAHLTGIRSTTTDWINAKCFQPLVQEAVGRGDLNIRLLGIGVRLRDPEGPCEQLSLF